MSSKVGRRPGQTSSSIRCALAWTSGFVTIANTKNPKEDIDCKYFRINAHGEYITNVLYLLRLKGMVTVSDNASIVGCGHVPAYMVPRADWISSSVREVSFFRSILSSRLLAAQSNVSP